MPRKRTSQPRASTTSTTDIPLSHPDRTPDPSRETLISWAESRNLFAQDPTNSASKGSDNDGTNDEDGDGDGEYQVGRLAESVLWSTSLVMVHFTLDFLIQHQYAQEMAVASLVGRALQAFPLILILFYILHPHPEPSILPGLFPLSESYDQGSRMGLFFLAAVGSGCYLIHITNEYSYYAVMKQAAPVGCVWIWSVVELSLLPALVSLLLCLGWLFWGGYSFL